MGQISRIDDALKAIAAGKPAADVAAELEACDAIPFAEVITSLSSAFVASDALRLLADRPDARDADVRRALGVLGSRYPEAFGRIFGRTITGRTAHGYRSRRTR